jgi:hypothetical protein
VIVGGRDEAGLGIWLGIAASEGYAFTELYEIVVIRIILHIMLQRSKWLATGPENASTVWRSPNLYTYQYAVMG